MKPSHYLRWLQRWSKEASTGKRQRFAENRILDFSLVQDWESTEVAQPVIKPAGQEKIFQNKIDNINLALKGINYLRIQPGQIFSFWHLVGNPTESKGYRTASIYTNHILTSETGGGLCQLSTAVYGVALRFGCKILERHQHSADLYDQGRYFPLGQDATISFPHKDLQFQNNFSRDIVLKCSVTGNIMKAALLAAEIDWEAVVKSEVRERIPKKMTIIPGATAQPGSDGKVVVTHRTVKFLKNGLVEEYLTKDYYQPLDQIIPV